MQLQFGYFLWPSSLPSLHQMMLMELTSSTDGILYDLNTYNSVSNEINFTNPIKQVANLIDLFC